jgi:hypothetical protein
MAFRHPTPELTRGLGAGNSEANRKNEKSLRFGKEKQIKIGADLPELDLQ